MDDTKKQLMPLLQTDSLHIKKINEFVSHEFWSSYEFWINFVIGILGIYIGWKAYKEASKAFTEAGKAKDAATAAKDAATEAAKAVKIQTVTIELTEIIQRLDKLDISISYQEARDFYSETNRKIRRLISPYSEDQKFQQRIIDIFSALDSIKESLASVRPFNKAKSEVENDNAVYFAIESEFSLLSGKLAEICGLFEQQNI